MGSENTTITNLRTIVIGCTPLARKVTTLLDKISDLVGVVNLSPLKGASKSNYDCMPDFARHNSYRMFWTEDINDRRTTRWVGSLKPDIIVQCGWSQIFKSEILNIPQKYCIGIHPSPLPVGRGAAIINWKIIESEGKTVPWGNSLFIMEEKTDTGDVLDFEPFDIEPRDDARTAYMKVDATTITMLDRTLPKIDDGSLTPIVQDKSKATRYYKRTPKDGQLGASWRAIKINDYVRALTHPYPGAYFETGYGRLFVWNSSKSEYKSNQKNGTIIRIEKNKGILLKVGDNSCLWLHRISIDDLEQWADEWAYSLSLVSGEELIVA